MRTSVYCIEAIYKGETGYVLFQGKLAGISPSAWSDDIATYPDRATAEAAADCIRAVQAHARPWDGLTGIKVTERETGAQ